MHTKHTKNAWLQNLVVRIQYAHTLLMMKLTSHTLYTNPRVRVKGEVYFVLYAVNGSLNPAHNIPQLPFLSSSFSDLSVLSLTYKL